ncbi:MAG: hypothetical protein E7505_10305 [Ruminococcus sp.]|nr:hypothetical protein [Ruminococcus sp.]
MMRMKKIAAVFAAVMIMIISAVPVCAADFNKGYIFDLDDSITASQEEVLGKKLEELSKKSGMNVAVLISDNREGKSSMVYADDFYDSRFGINTDGILLYIDNFDKTDHISTSGKGIQCYSETYIDYMFDTITPCLNAGDYNGAVEDFLEVVDPSYVKRYNFTHSTLKYAGIGLLAGIVISVIACLIIAYSYKSHKKYNNRNYVVSRDTHFTVKEDRYLRQYTTKVKIENSSGGSRGGGGGTHISSSGGVHGGHSRRR